MNQTELTQEALIPRFFRVVVANVLSNLMVPLATIFSTAFLGHLAEIHHLAGVALAGNLLSFVFLLLVSLRMSTTGLTAQAVGGDDREAMLLVGARNLVIALVFGLVLIALQYPIQYFGLVWVDAPLEVIEAAIDYFKIAIWGAPAILMNYVLLGWFLGQEKNSTVLWLSLINSAFNIALDYLLVIHWSFASLGAGISSTISQYLVLLLGIVLVFREVSWKELTSLVRNVWHPEALKEIFGLNSDLLINNLFFVLAFLIFSYEGIRLGTTTYTENALLIEVASLNAFLAEGIGFGVETLSGHYQGKGTSDQMAPLIGIAIGASLLMGFGLAGTAILFPATVFGLFTDHAEVTGQVGRDAIWLFPLLGFTSIALILEAYFLGLTKGAIVRNVSLISFFVGFVPASLVAWQLGSNSALWLSYCLFLVARTVGFGIFLPGTLRADLEALPVVLVEVAGEAECAARTFEK